MVQEATARALSAMVKMSQEVDQWDEFPMLMVIRADAAPGLLVLDGDIFEMLRGVGPAIRGQGVNDVTGLVLVNEGWALSNDKLDGADAQEVAEDLYRRGLRFEDHPAAIEVKIFTAMDSEGMEMLKIERGNPEVQPSPGDASGRLPDHLRTLLMELTD